MCVFWVMIWPRNLHWCFQWPPHYISSGEVPGLFCPGEGCYLHIQVEHICGCQSFPCTQENLWQQWHLPSPLSCYLRPMPRDTGHPRVAGGHCQSTPGPVQALNIYGLQLTNKQTKLTLTSQYRNHFIILIIFNCTGVHLLTTTFVMSRSMSVL